MLRRLPSILLDRRVQLASDAALALVLLGASLAETTVGADEWSGPAALEVAVAVLSSVPLLWRRSRPLLVAAIVVCAAIASGAVVAPVQGPFETFLAFEIALYSVGLYASTRRGAVALAAALVGGMVAWAVTAARVERTHAGDWFPMLVWAVGAWLVGRIIRRHGERNVEFQRLSVALAAERDARAREAVTVERARIARELHDVIAHNVSVMSVQAAAAGRVLGAGETRVSEALGAIERTGRETVDEMRRMLGVLRKHDDELSLAPQPGLGDLDALARQLRAAGLAVEVHVEGTPMPLPAGLELSAYRIVQEALTNALKHAGPARCEVTVHYEPDAVRLAIVDDGAGRGDGEGSGQGLIGMRERVALFGGELEAGRRDEGGWALRARLPLGAT